MASIRLITSSRRSAVWSLCIVEAPFDSAKLILQEADEHIGTFNLLADAFVHQDNWTHRIDVDPKTGEQTCKIVFKTDIPPKLTMRAYDIFRYARDALDHALFASAKLTSGKADPKRCKFPFGDTPQEVESEIDQRKCDDLHAKILKIIIASRPYEAGNRTLWAMNKIRNGDTHKVLTPTAVRSGFSIGEGRMNSVALISANEWKATSRQLTYLRVRMDAASKFQLQPLPTLSINSTFGLRGPASESIRDVHDTASKLVAAIEVETFSAIDAA